VAKPSAFASELVAASIPAAEGKRRCFLSTMKARMRRPAGLRVIVFANARGVSVL